LTLGLSVILGFPAAADDAAVLVADKDRKVTLTGADDGTATAAVTLANPADATPNVQVTPKSSAVDGCTIDPDPEILEPHQQQNITLTFSAACDIDREAGTAFTLTVGGGDPFEMHANPPTEPSPNWAAMGLIYLGAAVLALTLLFSSYKAWKPPLSRYQGGRHPRMSLPGLAASWKFSDSWAANATVITALFTGVFGADKVTVALLGKEGSTDLLAVALVSAAISVGLAGLSPMLLQMLRERFDEQPEVPAPPGPNDATQKARADPEFIAGTTPADLYVTPIGLIAAAVLTLTSTAGQLATILYSVVETDFAEDWILYLIGFLSLVLLGAYAWINTQQNLTTGATLAKYQQPKPPAPDAAVGTEAVRAAGALKERVSAGASIKIDGQTVAQEAMLAILDEATAPPQLLLAPVQSFRDERPSGIL
jgi:hypothetical protein